MSDPYVYPNTNVLINKLNLKDNDELERYENVVTNLSLLKILDEHPKIQEISDIKQIHKLIFSDVYEWAGAYRTINTYKSEDVINGNSVDYSYHKLISHKIEQLNKEIKQFNWDINDQMLFTKQLAMYMSKLWQIHPFREGNTRTTVTFFTLLLKQKNINFNEQVLKIHAAYFRNALVMACLGMYSKMNYLEDILNDALFTIHTTKVAKDNKEKYSTINGYDVSKYKYNYHSSKK